MPRDAAPSAEDPLDADRRALDAARAALYRPDADDAVRQHYADLAVRLDLRRASAAAPLGADRARHRRRWTRRTGTIVAAIAVTAIAAVVISALALPRSVAVRATSPSSGSPSTSSE